MLDRGFDVTVEAVIAGFLCEGFTIRPLDGGDLRRDPLLGDPLRYAVLVASLPELGFAADRFGPAGNAILGCHITVYELVSSCTLVIAADPLADYPLLASLVPRLTDRVGSALSAIAGASEASRPLETITA
jgi:hypothetical protein